MLETSKIPVSDIVIHDLSVVVPLQKNLKTYQRIASKSFETLPTIRLGRINGQFYVLSHLDVFLGIKNAGREYVESNVECFSDEQEFVLRHVKENRILSGYNPLHLYKVRDYLLQNGISHEEASIHMQIQNTIDQRLLDLNLEKDTVKKLSELFYHLAEILSNCVMPYYISEQVSKIKKGKQIDAVSIISKHITENKISDAKFSWPSLETIKTLLARMDSGKNTSCISLVPGEKPTQNALKFAEKVISISRHTIIIPETNQHPSYFVNKKTNTVSIIDEKKNAISLVDSPSTSVFTLPKKAVDHLKLTKSLDVKMKIINDSKDLKEFLKKYPDMQGVFFYK